MQTITGTESFSASRKAWTCRSTASWLESAKSWIHPQSRWDMESEWSFQMLMGAPIARLATVITIGSPRPEALYKRLGHEQQSLARGGGIGACTRCRSTDTGRHGAELRLDHQVFAGTQVAGSDEVGETFDDVGLG